jgi:hypothetical protein
MMITRHPHASRYLQINRETSAPFLTLATIAMIAQKTSTVPINLAIEKEGASDQEIDRAAHAKKIEYNLKDPWRHKFDFQAKGMQGTQNSVSSP